MSETDQDSLYRSPRSEFVPPEAPNVFGDDTVSTHAVDRDLEKRREERRERRSSARREKNIYEARLGRAVRIVPGEEVGLPGVNEVEMRTWPYKALAKIERNEDGEIVAKKPITEEAYHKYRRRLKNRAEAAQNIREMEGQIDTQNEKMRQVALETGRPELVIDNPAATKKDMDAILAKRAALETNKLLRERRDELLSQQRVFELATGEFGDIPDPDAGIDHIRQVLARKAELEEANIDLWEQVGHERHQQEIRHEQQTREFSELRQDADDKEERGGILEKFKKVTGKLARR